MNWRKLTYTFSPTQKSIINVEKMVILDACDKQARSETEEQMEFKTKVDTTCPHCKTKDNVVNKIAHVYGSGSVGGHLFGVKGNVLIDTNEVNHCNTCGNEWKKYKPKTVSQTRILTVYLRYLSAIIRDPEEKKNSWKWEAIQIFNDYCHAETIYELNKASNGYCYYPDLTLSVLRKYYKSVFDKAENMKKLKKL